MSLNKSALIKAERVHVHIGEESAEFPGFEELDPKVPAAGWAMLGFTSKSEPVAISSEGGEITTIDTAEEDSVIAVASAKVRTLAINALQFDAETLDLAYNGSYDEATKTYSVPTTSVPLTKKVLVIITTHSGKVIGLGCMGALSAGDEPSLSFEELSKVNLRATVLGSGGESIRWIGVEQSAA